MTSIAVIGNYLDDFDHKFLTWHEDDLGLLNLYSALHNTNNFTLFRLDICVTL
jgi:hypothetical protein